MNKSYARTLTQRGESTKSQQSDLGHLSGAHLTRNPKGYS